MVENTILCDKNTHRYVLKNMLKLLMFYLFFRFLGTGNGFRDLSFTYLRGENTIGQIVQETCHRIWEVLSPIYMPFPSAEIWKVCAEKFEDKWQRPNYISAVDGKHIRIRQLSKSGSAYYNYMGFFFH